MATSPPDEPELVGTATRRRLLGRELRRLRAAAGLAIAGAAATSGLSTATISRLESAKQKPLAKNVRMLCQVYGADDTLTRQLEQMARESKGRGWSLDYAGLMPGWAQRYADEQAEASEIWTYQAEHVPGVLQTATYGRVVTAANRPDITAEELEGAVDLRLARQRVLERAKLHAVINEGALRRSVGGPDVMREQLTHLRTAAQRQTIDLQVLPFTAGAHPAVVPFVVLHFSDPDADPTIYVEIDSGAVYPDEFERYNWVWHRLRELALSTDDSVDFLDTLIREL